MSASIFLLFAICVPMPPSAPPKETSPREQVKPLQEEIQGPTEEYSNWVIKKQLNTPGIYEIYLTFRPSPSFHAVPDLLVWRPWKQRRLDTKAGPRILELRQSAERDLFGFWTCGDWVFGDWGFTVRLSARKYKGESATIECDQPAGLSGNHSVNGSIGIDGVSKFTWESSQRFDYQVEKKPKPREYIEKLVISGKPVECPCVEAIFP